MKESELLLKELATLVDIDALNTITMRMEYDEVKSLIRAVIDTFGPENGRKILAKIAPRIRQRSPTLYAAVSRHVPEVGRT
jgi:hypothetical protein